MATQQCQPGDFVNFQEGLIGQLTSVDMTTAAVFFVLKNSGSNIMVLTHVAFTAFSAFPEVTALPSSWAHSWGTNSTTTPTNMYNTTLGSSAVNPMAIAQPTDSVSPYILPGQSLYYAVVTTTGGVGTIGKIRFCGGTLKR